jgi:hypothetical protein
MVAARLRGDMGHTQRGMECSSSHGLGGSESASAEDAPEVPSAPNFFAQTVKHNRFLSSWSPDGRYLASALRTTLTIRYRDNMQVRAGSSTNMGV